MILFSTTLAQSLLPNLIVTVRILLLKCRPHVSTTVRTSKNTGIMFLNEVALGEEHTITQDNCSLKKPPTGFHSVVARGQVEPGRHTQHPPGPRHSQAPREGVPK